MQTAVLAMMYFVHRSVCLSVTRCCQGHLRWMILIPIENAYATSYYSVIVVLSCTVSEIQRLFG